MKKMMFAVCLLALILSACAAPMSPVTNIPATSTTEIQASSTVSILPAPTQMISATTTAFPSPTLTQISPIATLPPSPTVNATGITSQCLKVTSDAQQFSGSNPGLLVIAQDTGSSEIYDKLKSPYLYNPANGKKTDIPGAYSFAVSLDNAQMAYVSADDKLVITDATGKPTSQHPFADIKIIQWGRDGLFVQGADRQPAFLNPFTGERKNLSSDYPNLYPEGYGLDPYWYPEVMYDPSLTRAVYPAQDPQTKDTYISFWDIERNTEIVSLSRTSTLFIPGWKPEWSVDGHQVILVNLEVVKGSFVARLVSVNKDGKITTILDIDKDMGTLYYSLSPNQESVAFWSPDPDSPIQIKNLNLYVLNIKTGELVDYCIVSPEIVPKPVWSPDSIQLAVELKQDMGHSEVVIVDLEKNIAVKIGENAQPVGWLK